MQRVKYWPAILGVALLAGCAHFHPQPIVPDQNAARLQGRTLTNAVLQVILPQDVQFQSSNPGIYNAADHTVTLSLGTLAVAQQGSMDISGVVLSSAVNRNLIVAENETEAGIYS